MWRRSALKDRFAPGAPMVIAALRYVISHPSDPVAIPGAKSPAQMNAEAGEQLFTAAELKDIQAVL